MDDATRRLRWRLILGPESRRTFEALGDCALKGDAAIMDQALAAIYDQGPGATGTEGDICYPLDTGNRQGSRRPGGSALEGKDATTGDPQGNTSIPIGKKDDEAGRASGDGRQDGANTAGEGDEHEAGSASADSRQDGTNTVEEEGEHGAGRASADSRQDDANTAEEEGEHGAGRGSSFPRLVHWLGDIRKVFSKELVIILQEDAVERCGLKQLLLEPELLDDLEPSVALASMLLLLREQVPQRSKEHVRAFIRRIVEELDRLLANEIRRAVLAALNRRRHSPIPLAAAMDYRTTIARSLKNYQPELGVIIPDRVYFFERNRIASHRRTVILDVDQSASMSESVIYATVMACALAGMTALKTHVVAFDTSVVDLTGQCDDPVDLLYGFQIGGGTNIERSLAYCARLVEQPSRTLLFLISDLYEGGDKKRMLRRLEELKRSGVTVVCLLTISNGGTPSYDTDMARRVAALGIPCLACHPELLPKLLSAVLQGRDLSDLMRNECL